MSFLINTNTASLFARSALTEADNSLFNVLNILSTGLRVNSAADDSAALSISNELTAQIRSLSQGIRNINDGISVAQIADSALAQAGNSLRDIRDLAVQAANGSYSAQQRAVLNQQVQSDIAQIDTIATQTSFNGSPIFSFPGGFNANLQTGPNVNQQLGISISPISSTTLGAASNYQATQTSAQTASTSPVGSNFAANLRTQYATALSASTVNGVVVSDVAANTNSSAKISALNAADTGVTATNYGNSLVGTTITADAGGATNAGDIVINGISVAGTTNGTVDQVVTQINAVSNQTGVYADASAGNTLVLFNTTGSAISMSINSANAASATGFANGSTSISAANSNGAIVLSGAVGSSSVALDSLSTQSALGGGGAGLNINLTNSPIATVNVSTQAQANQTIIAVDQALAQIDSQRAAIGAQQNRLQAGISLDSASLNGQIAERSNLIDADYAQSLSTLVKSLILQKSAFAVFAQSNLSETLAYHLLSI